MSFRASKRLRKFKTRKTAKNSKFCCNLKIERTEDGVSNGIGGWPPISTWIIKAQNGSGSARPENLLKIVSCAECETLQELMVQVQME